MGRFCNWDPVRGGAEGDQGLFSFYERGRLTLFVGWTDNSTMPDRDSGAIGAREADMSTMLVQATYGIDESDLPYLALAASDLPDTFRDFTRVREDELDNARMAENGFEDASEERYREIGRINGFVREFWSPDGQLDLDGEDVMAGTVAHLFETPEGVSRWISEVFLGDFANNVGSPAGDGQILVGIDRFEPEGFFDEAAGIRARYDRYGHAISATIIDFRVGRILGVAYIATLGDYERISEANELGMAMEQGIVAEVLRG